MRASDPIRRPRPGRSGLARRNRRRGSAVVAAVAVLAGCASDDGTVEELHTSAGGTALSAALDRIAASDAAAEYIEFGATQRIDELSGGSFDGVWGSLDGWGSSPVARHREELPDVLGIDLRSAASTLTVNQPPHSVTLIEGGQDAARITSASTDSGWSGDDVLSLEMEVSQPLSIPAPHVMPTGSDVAVGAIAADMSIVDPGERSLADAPSVGGIAACLDDVVAALILRVGSDPVGLGVRESGDTDRPVSVVCVPAPTADDAERLVDGISHAITSGAPASGRPYSDLFAEPSGTVLRTGAERDHVVRVEVPHADGAFANTMFQLALSRELPGLTVDGSPG
ncbi:hypothetical protein G1H11_07630 [Phytoactinopolyspora alkaliphila]|uniref:Uncharacterized protein n=1 Tax=Phytoactinopolyspora alkaliphila TaxID=1783498 RepID=A0A6N9YJP7_9ACTN|nr:hypothetical protein [Phytoactinopolyspora alkaliphila]NED95184.1 hypothetical protein [Phytoactinopolyspora alkaliphila]